MAAWYSFRFGSQFERRAGDPAIAECLITIDVLPHRASRVYRLVGPVPLGRLCPILVDYGGYDPDFVKRSPASHRTVREAVFK
jgi:hypothetical protein